MKILKIIKNKTKVKTIFLLLAVCICTIILSFHSSAQEANTQPLMHIVEYEEDGSYYVTELTTGNLLARSTVNGRKSSSYYSASGKLQWKVTVIGSYTYNGTTSSCTNASVSVSNIAKGWSVASQKASKERNTAIGTATFKNKESSVTRTVRLTCSPSGKLS